MLKRLFGCLCLLFALPALAGDIVTVVQKQLQQPAVLKGEFIQLKRLEGFKKPLESRGRFIVVRERGVLWQTIQPFASTMKITRDEIVQKDANRTTFHMDASKEPVIRAINSVLFSIFSGDVARLQHLFTIDGESTDKGWRLLLRPKDATMIKVIREVHLTGDKLVESIEIRDTNGDQTSLRFTNMNTAGALTIQEKSQFD